MQPVFQTTVSKEDGDCTRACIASLLDLPIDAVPHFMRFATPRFKNDWFGVLKHFLLSIGYDCYGTGFPHSHKIKEYSIDGFVVGSVPSKTFENIGHSVVVNSKGICIHDPNPNKKWKGVNVKKSGDLKHWLLISQKGKKECDR